MQNKRKDEKSFARCLSVLTLNFLLRLKQTDVFLFVIQLATVLSINLFILIICFISYFCQTFKIIR